MPPDYARPFQIRWPNGAYLDGVQFPSGRCVVDGGDAGPYPNQLMAAAPAFEDLPLPGEDPDAYVVWADGGGPRG